LEHDFLCEPPALAGPRPHRVFNRSYYEEVLIVRVHPEILAGEGVPEEDVWKGRYRSIVDLEKHLHRNGTVVIKFFLHLSKKEQRKRFLERIDTPDKNWKFSAADVEERNTGTGYMKAYEACLSATSTKNAPWHVVRGRQVQARLIVSRIVIDALRDLKMSAPKVTAKRRRELQAIRKRLAVA